MALIQTAGLSLPARAALAGNQLGVPSGIASELLVSELLPRYSHLAKLGRIQIARAPLVTLTLAATAYTGLAIWNNSAATNPVDLHLLKLTGNVAVTSAAMTGIALGGGVQGTTAPTGTTLATQSSSIIGGPSSGPAGIAYSAATLAVAATNLLDLLHNTAAIAVTGEDNGFSIDLEGSIIIPPGGFVAFSALGAASAAGAVNLSAIWAALPA
jgi:hypothetical protein